MLPLFYVRKESMHESKNVSPIYLGRVFPAVLAILGTLLELTQIFTYHFSALLDMKLVGLDIT